MVLPPRMVESLHPRITETAGALLGAAETDEELDLLDQFAMPLTIIVITEPLGLAAEIRAQLKRWVGVFVAAQECKRTAEAYDPASVVAVEVFAFFHEQIEQPRRDQEGNRPARPGLLSVQPAVHDQDDDRLSELELIVTCALLFVAGHDTAVNLIGNGLFALLRHPEQPRLLRDHPEKAPTGVEEFLRYGNKSSRHVVS